MIWSTGLLQNLSFNFAHKSYLHLREYLFKKKSHIYYLEFILISHYFCFASAIAMQFPIYPAEGNSTSQEVLVPVKWDQFIFHPILIRKLALKQMLLEQLSACLYNIYSNYCFCLFFLKLRPI